MTFIRHFVSGLVAALSLTVTLNAASSDVDQQAFKENVLPILRSHCFRCHGPESQEARVRIDNLSTDLVNDRVAAETWHEILNVLNRGEMPPEDESPLSMDQRETVTKWVRARIEQAAEASRNASGRVVLRRLNRVEYQHTMFDLLGLDMDYARDLPPDPASQDGFRNNGESLQMSALQLEYFLDTARRALDRVIVSGDAPRVYEYDFEESNVRGWLRNVERSNRLGRRQAFLATMVKDYPEAGEFLIRVKCKAEQKESKGFPLLEVSVGYRPDTKVLFREVEVVEITSADEQVLEFRGRLENHPLPVRGQGKFPGLVVRLRNVYDDGTPLPRGKGKNNKKKGAEFAEESEMPVIVVESVHFRAPVFEQWPPALHRKILFDSPQRDEDERAYVTEVLNRFMKRAYRRPVEAEEVSKMVDFFSSVREEFPTFEEAIRETLAMVLIRPDFLFLLEPSGTEKRKLDDWELASRLSYFLWSTMPDERLFHLAEEGRLGRPDVLSQEVERLLADPRSERFVEQFTDQWLHLDGVDHVAVSREYYPKFNDNLKAAMKGETQAFFAELLRGDVSATNFLDSDFAMLNEQLARHYGVPNVFGREFRRVKLPEGSRRGGLLGQAAILLANSTGSDSHAVRRAVWIRDRLLNDPPPPPPPNVPSLDEADAKFQKLSVREQLEVHRGTEACASCHRNIDPWGIALENYDAVGLWREEIRRKSGKRFESFPVQASDTLPNGRKLDGAGDLKRYLASERKKDFSRSLVSRLLGYAVGRRIEWSDQATIDELEGRFAKNHYRMRGLIQEIVASDVFQTK